ncbi:hypothetical protein M011DRAFT_472337 [Sporormia fimetaria CBS 119925]|uniref:Spo7-domain-containing protein n=1 Tax=Sporormia fimetaria CBS 119925 TaxID=1340428 RepID=A0A6A6UXQ5_9PLEO|nr:hypothetical protein M011DRAFT_472337 [Sporormia fimetaria CBS 119925]
MTTSTPSTLDQLVKGAPQPGTTPTSVTASAAASPPPHPHTSLKTPIDPVSLLPSSPSQIYLNLLILEASLRSQYLTLRARRRQNTFVLTLLTLWLAAFSYTLFLRPRGDGKLGGSEYWVIDLAQKLCFVTGLVTLLLFWATGQWERGVRWPRRWIGIANRGLRGMNAKIVVIRGPWWKEFLSYLAFLMPGSGGLWGGEMAGGSSYHYIAHRSLHHHHSHSHSHSSVSTEKHSGGLDEHSTTTANSYHPGRPRTLIVEDGKEYAEEDIAPGGDAIKLLLLPKPFTPDFREGWEVFRAEYWERENERRGELRKRVAARQREMRRAKGGVFWWLFAWRGSGSMTVGQGRKKSVRTTSSVGDVERGADAVRVRRGSGAGSTRERERRRRPSSLREQASEELLGGGDERERDRRWSNSTTGSLRSESRRKKNASVFAQAGRQAPSRLGSQASGLRPGTPGEGQQRPGLRGTDTGGSGSTSASVSAEGFEFPSARSA